MSSLLDATLEVAQLGGRIALEQWRAGILTEWKDDGSPVTAADRAAERAIREWVTRRFPGDAILGEELGDQPGTTGRRWLIDPIDGTRAFIAGVPLWGSLVAVMEGGRVLAGAAVFPAVSETLAAAPGEGCWHNGTSGGRARVSGVGTLGEAVVCTTDISGYTDPEKRAGWERLAREARGGRTWGDCYGYLLVATGRAEAMLDPVMNPWDSACLQPIITEAGGVFTDWDGRETPIGGNSIATNAALAATVREVLRRKE